MKKIFLNVLCLLLLTGPLMAQTKTDNRTITTRIADVLALFPANDAAQLNHNVKEISAMGEPGILGMAKMLVPPGKGDNSKLEYALGGYSYYVSQGNHKPLRLVAANAYVKA